MSDVGFGKNLKNQPDEVAASPLKTRRKSLFFMGFVGFLTFFGGLILGLYSFVNYKYEAKPKAESQEVIFEVKRGSGLSTISKNLYSQGLVENEFLFKIVTKLRGNEANFKAGEYALSMSMSQAEIYDVLSEGKAILYPFTVPEGRTSVQILRAMAGMDTLVNDNPPVPPEGSLLPETYLTPRGMTHSALITKMQNAQTSLINRLWENRRENLPIKTKAEAINLAAVVEKETGIGAERAKVAGVFINRLNIGMKLESDPTIIYGISKGEILVGRDGKQRGLRRSEIDRVTPWNTYQIPRLPKTPICNPGADAIAAVLNPAKTEAIFFVADGTGGHAFAKTLREHNRNVAKWRKIERARRQAGR